MRRDLVCFGLGLACSVACVLFVARTNERLERQLDSLTRSLDQTRLSLAKRSSQGTCSARIDSNVLQMEARRAFAELGAATCDCGQALDGKPALSREQDPATSVPAGPEAIAAFDQANELVANALSRSTWTDHDRDQLRSLAVHMDVQTLSDTLAKLARAINEGKVTATGRVF